MDENETLKLEVQGLRSLMLQGVQLPGSSAIPTPALQVSCRTAVLHAHKVAAICNEGDLAPGLAERWHRGQAFLDCWSRCGHCQGLPGPLGMHAR